MYVCTYLCKYLCMYVCMYVWIDGCMDACMHVCVYIYICKIIMYNMYIIIYGHRTPQNPHIDDMGVDDTIYIYNTPQWMAIFNGINMDKLCLKHVWAKPHICKYPNNTPRQYSYVYIYIVFTWGGTKTSEIYSDLRSFFGFHYDLNHPKSICFHVKLTFLVLILIKLWAPQKWALLSTSRRMPQSCWYSIKYYEHLHVCWFEHIIRVFACQLVWNPDFRSLIS